MNNAAGTITGTTTSVLGTAIGPQQSLVLSLGERRDLSRLQTVVRRDSKAFVRVCLALFEIKERKLYREKFSSFEAYCQAVFGWSRSHAYRLLDAAEVCAKMSPMGDTATPTSERQVRALAGLPPEVVKEAWNRAVEGAQGGLVTESQVKRAVAEVRGSPGAVTQEKLSWQLQIEPLLKEALAVTKRGDRDHLESVVQRISLLLLIGQGSQLKGDVLEEETCQP